MKAVFFRKPGDFIITDRPIPKLTNQFDIMLKVKACGICATDLHIVSFPQRHVGSNNIILGHEIIGEIVDIYNKNESLFKIGDLCTLTPNVPCLICSNCLNNMTNICLDEKKPVIGITVDGGLSEYVSVPSAGIYKISSDIDIRNAIFAEPLHCILDGFEETGDIAGKNILILGLGTAGLMYTLLSKYFNAKCILSTDLHDFRVKKALELGSNISFSSKGINLIEYLKKNHSDIKIDIVIDTVGTLVGEALEIVQKGGRVIIYGLESENHSSIRPYDLVRNKKSILGGFANNKLMPKANELLKNIDFTGLISKEIKIEEMTNQTLVDTESPNILKQIVYP